MSGLIDIDQRFNKCKRCPCLRIHYHPDSFGGTVVLLNSGTKSNVNMNLSIQESTVLRNLVDRIMERSAKGIKAKDAWVHARHYAEERTFTDFVPDFLLDESTQF